MQSKSVRRTCACGLHVGVQEERAYLTLEDLSSRWKVNVNWVYKNHRRIGLVAMKPGGQKLRFPLDCLIAWESKHQFETANQGSTDA